MRKSPVARVLCAVAVALWASSASAWGPSAHAWIARQSLGKETGDAAIAFVVLGSVTPDFFWYMADTGAIGYDTAYKLHGATEEPGILDSTTFFYDFFSRTYAAGNDGMACMAEGIRIHVYADVLAHNTLNGYVEGQGMWIDTLRMKTGESDREALHLAIEFAVDALVVRSFGPQLGPVSAERLPGNLPAVGQFREYFSLLQAMEAAASLYGAYLLRMGENPLEKEGRYNGIRPYVASPYARAAVMLLRYPREMLETVTEEGMHWEEALTEVVAYLAQ